MCWTWFKTVGHSSKNLGLSQKTLRPFWRPNLVTSLMEYSVAACRCYQNSKCRSRLTTRNAESSSNSDPQHNHSGNKDIILAHQAVAEMKDEMDEVSATTLVS